MADRAATGPGAVRRPATAAASILEEPVDLHADLAELLRSLAGAGARRDVIDTYLVACGIAQVVEDWLDGIGWSARRAAALLGGRGASGRAVRVGVDAAAAIHRTPAAGRRVLALHGLVTTLISVLADAVVDPLVSAGAAPGFPGRADELVGRVSCFRLDRLPGRLCGQLMRPPSCFRSFDQHPRDLVELASRFAALHPERDRWLLVLGVRTSGGYLAPLTAAALRAMGYRQAAALSVRPGARLPRTPLLSARTGRGGGLVLVVDDPPSTGGSMAAVAQAVQRRGFGPQQIVPVFAAFGSGTAPPALRGYPCVVLPAADWHIRKLLSPAALRTSAAAAFPDRELIEITADEPGLPSRDGHLAVRCTAWFRDGDGMRPAESVELVAEGAGTGYLGRHAVAVASRLPTLVPRVHGYLDGVLLRAHGAAYPAESVPPETMVGYAAARQRDLAVGRDRSAALQGRQPVWEIGARILARGFGRLGPAVRPFLVDPALRSFLRADNPCLIDGRTAVSGWEWNAGPSEGLRKTDFDDGSFSHLDLAAYDAAYDLAGAAARVPQAEQELLDGFEQVTGDRVDRARWCVYLLVQAWNLDRVEAGPVPGTGSTPGSGSDQHVAEPFGARRGSAPGRRDAGRIQARAVQDLFGRLFLGDLDSEPDGPWCVLDVDGVLELDFGGFPATTVSGMGALRALRAHGFRVVLATGRSAPEVLDRCAAYRLAGGVAEYGAVVCDARGGAGAGARPPDPWVRRREALVADLSADPSVRLDPKYSRCVRATRYADGARRTGLDARALERIAAAHPGFTPVRGDAQTDFVPEGVTKEQGVRHLLGLFGDAQAPVALAVGDTAMDLGILRMARLGLAPAHADDGLRAAGVGRTRSPYQDGLAQAVARLLGHRPGSCRACRTPRLTPGEQLVLGLLSAGQGGRRGFPSALRTVAAARRSAGSGSGTRVPA